jgi:hypothetical protein
LANLRTEFGHYECDSVESCMKKSKTKPLALDSGVSIK